jgi:hypothetical protein
MQHTTIRNLFLAFTYLASYSAHASNDADELIWNGNMDTAIAIRTAIIADGQLHIQIACQPLWILDPAHQ